jgi:hypothetical protein
MSCGRSTQTAVCAVLAAKAHSGESERKLRAGHHEPEDREYRGKRGKPESGPHGRGRDQLRPAAMRSASLDFHGTELA